jgi:hypothetical protein
MSNNVSFEEYFTKWIQRGSPWFQKNKKPLDWSLDKQLLRAGLKK